MSYNSIDDLKKVAINLNIKGKNPMSYSLIVGHPVTNINNCIRFSYTLFTDENMNCYLLSSSSFIRKAFDKLGIKNDSVGLDSPVFVNEEDPEVKKMNEFFQQENYKIKMIENFNLYKRINDCEKLSFYGIDYELLDIDNSLTINLNDSVIRLNLVNWVDNGRFAMYDIIPEKQIIVCYDEWGRLLAFRFADNRNLNEAVIRLNSAGFKKGFSRYCTINNFDKFYSIKNNLLKGFGFRK